MYKSENVPAERGEDDPAGRAARSSYSYDQIGVAIASSSNASFASNLLKADKSVDGASATARFATRLEDTQADGAPAPNPPNAPATD